MHRRKQVASILGNGFTQLETEAEEKEKNGGEMVDLAFYIERM